MLKLNEEIEVNIEAEQRDNLQTKIRELEELKRTLSSI